MLIVGLGNPGQQYARTRHNAGWIQLESFARFTGLSFTVDKKHRAMVARGNFQGKNITLAIPQTFMNLSGESVISLAHYYRYIPEEIVIAYDDKDFDLGVLKIRTNGSAGGHNGIKSLITHLGTQQFPRLRIGIGPKPKEMEMSNFVLSAFSQSDLDLLHKVCERGNEALEMIILKGVEDAMQIFNRKE